MEMDTLKEEKKDEDAKIEIDSTKESILENEM